MSCADATPENPLTAARWAMNDLLQAMGLVHRPEAAWHLFIMTCVVMVEKGAVPEHMTMPEVISAAARYVTEEIHLGV